MTLKEFKNLKSNDIIIYFNYDKHISELTLYKQYIINDIDEEYCFVVVTTDENYVQIYDYQFFMTLQEYEIIHRNDKIKKILNDCK